MPRPKNKEVKNEHGVYDRDHWKFSDADRIAYTVHAVLHSGEKSQSSAAQDEINRGTTAVAITDNQLFFAFNYIAFENRNYQGRNAKDFFSEQDTAIHYSAPKTQFGGPMEKGGKKQVYKKEQGKQLTIWTRRATIKWVPEADLLKELEEIKKLEGVFNSYALPTLEFFSLLKNKKRPIRIEYIKDHEYHIATYKLRSANTERYNPKELLSSIIKTLSNDDPSLAQKRPVVLKQNVANPREHAEMQLWRYLDQLFGHNAKQLIRSIGVSKPCCHECADVLSAQGIEYSAWTQLDIKNNNNWWVGPDQIDTDQYELIEDIGDGCTVE